MRPVKVPNSRIGGKSGTREATQKHQRIVVGEMPPLPADFGELDGLVEDVGQRRVGARNGPHRKLLHRVFERELPFDVTRDCSEESCGLRCFGAGNRPIGSCQCRVIRLSADLQFRDEPADAEDDTIGLGDPGELDVASDFDGDELY